MDSEQAHEGCQWEGYFLNTQASSSFKDEVRDQMDNSKHQGKNLGINLN